MAISWGTIKSLLLFFGPILLPKAIAYYRSVRAAPSIHGIPIRSLPPSVSRALGILFAAALIFLTRSFTDYYFSENIFSLTKSRLQIPTDVLFTRLSALRPQGLTSQDMALRSKFNAIDSRLLYLQFGPDVLRDCQFCTAEDPNSYLYYSIPGIVAPHLFNLCILALVTSDMFTGKEGAVWRMTATLAAGAIALVEIYAMASFRYQDNKAATRLEDIDFFYWKIRSYRYIALAAMDGFLGWVLYLSSTNRAFLNPPSPIERIDTSLRIFDVARNKISSIGVVRNTVNRDEDLRNRSQSYWIHEGRLMNEVMEESEVVRGVNDALENRIRMVDVARDAEAYAEHVIGPLQNMNGNL